MPVMPRALSRLVVHVPYLEGQAAAGRQAWLQAMARLVAALPPRTQVAVLGLASADRQALHGAVCSGVRPGAVETLVCCDVDDELGITLGRAWNDM